MEDLTIKGELIFEFNNFSQWVNNASRLFKPFKHCKTIALAKDNSIVHIGEDFTICKDWDLFPVKVYKLQRTAETGLYF